MKMMKLIIYCIMIVVQTLNCLTEFGLIQNYFTLKYIKTAAIFSCFQGSTEEIVFQKKLMQFEQTVSLHNFKYLSNFTQPLQTTTSNFGVIVNGNCPNAQFFLEECGEKQYYNVRRHWLVFSFNQSFADTFNYVETNINADVIVAIKESHIKWALYDVYNPASKHGGRLNITRIGYYNPKYGYQVYIPLSKYSSRRNLTGTRFKSMIVLPDPFDGTLEDYLQNDENRTVNTFNRYHSTLVFLCRDFYNFSLSVKMTHSWGYLQPDGKFDGMVGELQNKTIDFGQSPVYVKKERIPYVDYCMHTWNIRTAFIFRNPKSLSSIQIFLQPLTTSVWVTTLVSAVVIVISIRIMLRFEANILRSVKSYTEFSWSFLSLMILGTFCQQGCTNVPFLIGGRILTIFVLLLSLIIYQFYSASIVSFLLMKPITAIKSVTDIIRSSLKVGLENVLYIKYYFQETTSPLDIELFKKKILQKNNVSRYYDIYSGLKRVQKEKFIFYTETQAAYPIIEKTFTGKEICELREIALVKFQHAHGTVQKHSPFHDMIDTCYQRLAETGLRNRQLKHWQARRPVCMQNENIIVFNVGIEEMYPALLIFVIGFFLSLALLVIEIFINIRPKIANKKENIKKVPLQPFVN